MLNLIQPKRLYLGQKDFQQLAILKKMVFDLCLKVEVIEVVTVRDLLTGLVLSSRNQRLSSQGIQKAQNIYQSLLKAKKLFLTGERNCQILIDCVRKYILESCGEVDYIQVVDCETLVLLEKIKKPAFLALAVSYEGVRLVDHIELHS